MSIASRFDMGDTSQTPKAEVLLGEDWVSLDDDAAAEGRKRRSGLAFLSSSPLARKIIIFNLIGLILLVSGVLYLNPFRDSLVLQHERGLISQSRLIANAIEARLAVAPTDSAVDMASALQSIDLAQGVTAYVFDPTGKTIGSTVGKPGAPGLPLESPRDAVLTRFLTSVWDGVAHVLHMNGASAAGSTTPDRLAQSVATQAVTGQTTVKSGIDAAGRTIFTVATPIRTADGIQGAVAMATAAGEIDQLVANEREQVLEMFVIAILVSIGLSLVLASTIANPLADLAAAAELGRDRNARKMSPTRVRIPDLTARPDEIGRLSVAMRGMVAALYDRIDANEQFAADVAHEIKNPLASLRSAVASMRLAKRDDQREKLLSVIEHDVRRLDRLVSDISNASRLDSELVREDEESFNLLKTVSNITDYLSQEASERHVDFITDLPAEPLVIRGLEARLAQVFVNIITNAVSFCEPGDAVRVWVRKRENRVLVVVEDTGP
ncbi:MAG: sensor histidine kinase, partial [Paracoccaceae bacterium]|nr:sensor histidine kinase [Paracoccaceae bacterium]